MQGSIRIILGLLVTMGAVGGMETESATILEGVFAAGIGLLLLASGVNAARIATGHTPLY